MFTGIIEDIGKLLDMRQKHQGAVIRVGTALDLDDVKLGDSIAVNGACLTVVAKDSGWFEADISHETLDATTMGQLSPRSELHLERAMALGGRLGGHLVTGHVDGVGRVVRTTSSGDGLDMIIEAPHDVARLLVPKGSVAVDGVSLTVNSPLADTFRVTLVPHTLEQTMLGRLTEGSQVNLETDIIGKYVRRFVLGGQESDPKSVVDEDFLAKHGFFDKGDQ